MSEAMTPMPRYQSHKKVWALKIAEIRAPEPIQFERPVCRGSFLLGSACGQCERCTLERQHPNGRAAVIVPADPGYAPFAIDAAYLRKHEPQVGGYFVVYEDGYRSFSPAEAFEAGYSRIQ